MKTPHEVSRHTPHIVRRRSLILGAVGAVAVAAGGYAYISTPPAFAGGELSVSEAHRKAASDEITLVDIRRPDEWKMTGIGEHALALDMRRDNFADLLKDHVGGDFDAPIALICAAGVRSARLSNRLTQAGFTNIINVPEGMRGSAAGPGWIKAGLPTKTWTE
ncbi:MAG: rhodanese-like domain-containing protein [Pseudomonadota bacterium]